MFCMYIDLCLIFSIYYNVVIRNQLFNFLIFFPFLQSLCDTNLLNLDPNIIWGMKVQ